MFKPWLILAVLSNALVFLATNPLVAQDKQALPKLPERMTAGLKLTLEVVADHHDPGVVEDSPWILVRTTDAETKILCGKTDINGHTGFGSKFEKPLIDQEGVFEIAVTKMVGEGYHPIFIKLSEKDNRNAVTFKYDQRGEFGKPGPYVELTSDWTSASHVKADDAGWHVRGLNIVTFVVKPRSVSVYVNGKFFSAVERDANKAFYEFNLMHTVVGMGATYVRAWK